MRRPSKRTVLVWTRITLYALVIALATTIIGISAYLEYIQKWKPFSAYILPFVVGLITVLIVLPMTLLDRLRQDAAIHQPRIELVWCGCIMLLWLAASMLFTIKMRGFPSCSAYVGRFFPQTYDSQQTWCRLHIALESILWVGFGILITLVVGIFLFGVINTERGYGQVWSTSITDFERPRVAPSSEFERDRQQAQAEVDAAMAEFQQRYEASLAESQPSLLQNASNPNVRGRPSSPTQSIQSAMRALGVVHTRGTSSDHVGGNGNRNGNGASATTLPSMAQHSSNSLVAGPSNSQRQLETIVDTPETGSAHRVYGAAV